MRNKNITAEIIADSINEQGDRLTSFVVTCPRIVLAEFNTHRMLSRNSASSRAIPFETMIQKVMDEPFVPIKWQADHKGMQGNTYLTGRMQDLADGRWLAARDAAVQQAKYLSRNIGATKQLCNRLLEPFLYHTIIVTASEWQNFFALRAHEAAEIHIQDLAFKMLDAYNKSTPKKLKAGEWHIPFGDRLDEERIYEMVDDTNGDPDRFSEDAIEEAFEEAKIKIATARCARVSYLNYEGGDDYEKDVKLHDRLSGMGHWSPFEHCAQAMTKEEYQSHLRGEVRLQQVTRHTKAYETGDNPKAEGWSGNFKGFVQYRKVFIGENKEDYRVEQKA